MPRESLVPPEDLPKQALRQVAPGQLPLLNRTVLPICSIEVSPHGDLLDEQKGSTAGRVAQGRAGRTHHERPRSDLLPSPALMRALGVCGVSRRKRPRTTLRDQAHRPAPDRVARDFAAAGPDRLWVADITYIPTWAGFLYLAVVVDAWSRRVIGWAMESHLRTELVLAALDMAVEQRRPADVIHHSDQGCQYTSIAFGVRCQEAGVRPSMGSVGDAYDNALCESFFATLECELLDRQRFATPAEARLAVFDFIEGWYNPRRRHSALDYLSPIAYERSHSRRDRTVASGSTTEPGGAILVSPSEGVR